MRPTTRTCTGISLVTAWPTCDHCDILSSLSVRFLGVKINTGTGVVCEREGPLSHTLNGRYHHSHVATRKQMKHKYISVMAISRGTTLGDRFVTAHVGDDQRDHE